MTTPSSAELIALEAELLQESAKRPWAERCDCAKCEDRVSRQERASAAIKTLREQRQKALDLCEQQKMFTTVSRQGIIAALTEEPNA